MKALHFQTGKTYPMSWSSSTYAGIKTSCMIAPVHLPPRRSTLNHAGRLWEKYLQGGAVDVMDSYKVWCFGEDTHFNATKLVLVDDHMTSEYPRILED